MARGLSDLQRWILKEANQPRGEHDGRAKTKILAFCEICKGYYGWKPRNEWDSFGRGGHNFSRREIGEKNYLKVLVAIHKSAFRLERRGLVERVWGRGKWAGLVLTEEGQHVASALLSAN